MPFDAKAVADSTLPKANSYKRVLFPDGDTGDIISAIMYADARSAPFTKEFARRIKGPTVFDTCSNLWKFVKENIKYQEDGFTYQRAKSPAQLWQDGVGDCKSFSIFIASCLKNLGIPYKYRFVSFSPLSKRVTHVYVVVPDADGEIICDAVWHWFNKQKSFYHKKDINGN